MVFLLNEERISWSLSWIFNRKTHIFMTTSEGTWDYDILWQIVRKSPLLFAFKNSHHNHRLRFSFGGGRRIKFAQDSFPRSCRLSAGAWPFYAVLCVRLRTSSFKSQISEVCSIACVFLSRHSALERKKKVLSASNCILVRKKD